MVNLAQVNYLHSHKWTFVNQAGKFAVNNRMKFNSEITKLITEFKTESDNLKKKEKDFYIDFGVNNNVEWARKYLINIDEKNSNKGQSTAQGAILEVIRSPQMIGILSGASSNSRAQIEAFSNEFIETLEDLHMEEVAEDIEREIVDAMEKDLSLTLERVFIEYLGARSTNKTLSKKQKQEIQQALWKKASKNYAKKNQDKTAKSGRVYSETSRYFAPYKQYLI